MKRLVAAAASGMLTLLAGVAAYESPTELQAARLSTGIDGLSSILASPPRLTKISPDTLTAVVHRTCGGCHSENKHSGDLVLEAFNVGAAAEHAAVAEKMITKLRTGMMPPPGKQRPGGDTLTVLATTLEQLVDAAAARDPDPGSRTFQRLNRAEYASSIHELLGLDVDAGEWLPLDTKSANFDNIADVQMPSATTIDGYLDAATAVSHLAVGDPHAGATSVTYKLPRLASQWDQAEGAPEGTRGGISVVHTFPADGQYVFVVTLHAIPTGQLFGSTAPFDEHLEISINGERVALLPIDRSMSQADPQGMEIRTDPIPVRAGAQRVSAAFLKTFDGPVNDNLAPIGHSIADTQIGAEYGITSVAHLQNLVITGPYNPTGVSDTETRRRIFTCRPISPDEERPCAEQIIGRLGAEAYRQPLSRDELKSLMDFFEQGRTTGGFEGGIRTALEAILSSPRFFFRVEELPHNARPGGRYPISSIDLASRLSFFLWDDPPDDSLMAIARRGALTDTTVLKAQTRRLLADPRSEALATRFAAQWLRLQDIDKVHPDALQYPDYREQLADDMRHETELFFYSIVRENRSVLDLFDANYTYVNEALARHYGIPGVTGEAFRRVTYPDDRRAGLLGQASILTLTSHANRTSPVLRGKWVMEVLLGSPPPPPPPGVPALEKTEGARDGHLLTTRERMEIHRANPTCRACHQFMDPIGLALDNFDVTGRWRIHENGAPLDTRGQLYDGTPISSPAELRAALLRRPIPLIRTFTLNLMAYALGRRVEYYDMPTVRHIAATAEADDYRFQDFVMGIVTSDAFRMTEVPPATPASGREP